MSHHVTIYGALWTTSKENNVINLVNGTVSQNTLPVVLRISCVVEPIFRRYHQTMSLLRPDSVHSSYKSLNRFPCRSDFSWGKNVKSKGAKFSEYGACCMLIFHSCFSLRESLDSSVYLIVLYTCCSLTVP